MPESLFGPREIDVRNLTVESPKSERRPLFDIEEILSAADWREVAEFAERTDSDAPDDIFFGSLKTISPNRFNDIAADFIDDQYRNDEFLRLVDYCSRYLRWTHQQDNPMAATLLLTQLNLQLLFPDRPTIHEIPDPDVEYRLKQFTAKILEGVPFIGTDYLNFSRALVSDALRPPSMKLITLPEDYWQRNLDRLVAIHSNDARRQYQPAWTVAAMRLTDTQSFGQLMARTPDWYPNLISRMAEFRRDKEWNKLFSEMFLAKIIGAHDVQVSPEGLIIQDQAPDLSSDTPLPEQKRY